MRTLIVSAYYFPATCYGGPVWVFRDVARGLAERGVDVEILTTSANQPRDDPERTEMIDGTLVRYERRLSANPWYFSSGLTRTALGIVSGFDVLYIPGAWTYPVSLAARAARWVSKPYIAAPHGSFDPWAFSHKGFKKRGYLWLIEKSNLRHAAAVHCLTQREKAQVLSIVPEARCEVIPNPVCIDPGSLTSDDVEAFLRRFPEVRGKRVVLFLSRVHRKKGLDLLIPAFASVRARAHGAHLVIAGPDDGGYRAAVERLVDEHRMREDVTFTGLLNGKDKLSAFNIAEVFALPSYSEGLPVAVLEALAFGKPVIITDGCNLTDEVTHAKAGLVVSTDVSGVSAGIELLLHDTDTARSMGEAARSLAKDKFSLHAVTTAFLSLFEHVTSQPNHVREAS